MPARHQRRITNGQRAAVCALTLAGVGFVESCRIISVPYRRLHPLLGEDWWGGRGREPHVWRGDKLNEVKQAYLEPSIPLALIETLYGLSRRHVRALARRHGWPRRTQGKGPPLPVPLAKMSDRQRNSYTKLSRILGREAALQAVFGP